MPRAHYQAAAASATIIQTCVRRHVVKRPPAIGRTLSLETRVQAAVWLVRVLGDADCCFMVDLDHQVIALDFIKHKRQ
eukprot:1633620-Pleurochrysis_carterae.AAC.1